MENVRMKISPPWVTVIHKIEALFGGDPQIVLTPNYEGKDPSIILSCNNGDKVTALQQILPSKFEFGNVALNIDIEGTPSDIAFRTKKDLFDTVFAGNPVYAYSVSPVDDGAYWFSMVYVVFKNCVVQFFNDNLDDCHGIISTLYQDIAKDILAGTAVNGVYFNTDVERGSVGEPINEWP